MLHRLSIRTIRLQLLVAVNLVVGTALLAGLVLDYRHELADRLQEKHAALQEEAAVMLPAIQVLRQQDAGAVQDYIDRVCARMQDELSPGHHIVVELEGTILQARAHHRASPAMLDAMEQAAGSSNWRASVGQDELIVGSSSAGGVRVYVSEFLAELRASLRRQLLWRLLGVLGIGLVGAGLLNMLLSRMVTKPLRRLVSTLRQVGAGELGVHAPEFRSEELSFVAQEVTAMSRSLAAADRQRRWQMAKAQRIQDHLHPKDVGVPGLQIATVYEPAEEVAGDYFDILPLPDGSWLLCIADVTGHGIPAAMGAAVLKTLLLAAAETAAAPGDILGWINHRFCQVTLPEDFASMLLVRWLPQNRAFEYASAGHEPAVLVSSQGAASALPSTGTLLGISETERWEARRLNILAGGRLLLFTDGLCESLSEGGRPFGRDRVARLFAGARSSPLDRATQQLWLDLGKHRGNRAPGDDITILTLEVQHAGHQCHAGRMHVRRECEPMSAEEPQPPVEATVQARVRAGISLPRRT